MIISARKGEPVASHHTPVDFSDEGILETKHLQKWILESPAVLGEHLLILDEEFREFETQKDRVDILCVDHDGHLVVVELKRTAHADFAELQALRYASMIRTMTLDHAASVLAESEHGKANSINPEGARQQIVEFISHGEGNGQVGELSSEPRIILVSPGFSRELLTTVHFLREHSVDISCISINAYAIEEGRYIIVPDRIYPVREIEELIVKVRKKEAAQESAAQSRTPRSLPLLVERGLLKDGDRVVLKHMLPTYVQPHFDEANPVFQGTIVVTPDGPPGIRWTADNKVYSPSRLAVTVFEQYRPKDKTTKLQLSGPDYWGTPERSLKGWADEVLADEEKGEKEVGSQPVAEK
jgi:hypothetical protein